MVFFVFVGMMFFVIGFVLGINFFLMLVLEWLMEMLVLEFNFLFVVMFVLFLIFGILVIKCIEVIGYKKIMVFLFIIFVIVFGLFI